MKDFSKEMLGALKIHLAGLNSFSRLVMYELLPYCDYQTGTISIDTLDVVARDNFHVEPSPGRKKEVVNGDTLRNAFRSIKKAKSDYFIFSTVNQRIIITMPFIRELYESMHSEESKLAAVLAMDVVEQKTLAALDESPCFDPVLATDVAGDLAAATSSNARVKKNNINKNKQTDKQTSAVIFSETRQSINPNFYPSAETIATALSRGHSTVTDEDQIKNFILFNQAISSRWVSFEPLYLRWLECDKGSKAGKAVTKTNKQRSDYHGRSSNTNRTVKQTMADVYRYNSNAIAPGSTRDSTARICIEGEYSVAVDTDESNLRANIYQQARCP